MIIFQQIEAELQYDVSLGVRRSFRLTLTAIAKHLDSSIQPVRTAVDALIKARAIATSLNTFHGMGNIIGDGRTLPKA